MEIVDHILAALARIYFKQLHWIDPSVDPNTDPDTIVFWLDAINICVILPVASVSSLVLFLHIIIEVVAPALVTSFLFLSKSTVFAKVSRVAITSQLLSIPYYLFAKIGVSTQISAIMTNFCLGVTSAILGCSSHWGKILRAIWVMLYCSTFTDLTLVALTDLYHFLTHLDSTELAALTLSDTSTSVIPQSDTNLTPDGNSTSSENPMESIGSNRYTLAVCCFILTAAAVLGIQYFG